MVKLSFLLGPSLLLSLFLCSFGLAEETTPAAKVVKVVLVPITVRGDYQPLDAATVNSLMLAAFKDCAPELEFVSLDIDPDGWDPEAAFQTAKDNGVDLIAWGSVSFQRSSQTGRDPYERGRLKLLITAIADIQVASVATQDRILSQPTMVLSSDQSEAFTESGDPQLERKLAAKGLQEAAKSIVEVVRQREAAKP